MKSRIIDRLSVSSHRRSSDNVWRVYANHLVTAFGDLLIQDGLNHKTASKLYCKQRIRELDNEVIESLIYTLPPAFIDYDDIKKTKSPEIHWGASYRSPFILLGHVGTGKSTFLDYTFLHKIPEKTPNFHAIIINFLYSQDNHDDFVKYLCLEINRQIDENIDPELADLSYDVFEKLFSKEFASYKASITNKKTQDQKIDELIADYIDCHLPGKEDQLKELIKRKIAYLKKSDMKIWIILDNIDQHHSCLQNDALVSSVSLAAFFNCPLIIAMRYISLTTPAAKNVYSSYRPRKLKLSFPDSSILIRKRLDYLFEISADIWNSELEWTGNQLRVRDLIFDIEDTVKSLADSDFMRNHLLPLSNYNMRRLLEIILSVFQSYFFFFDRFNNNRYLANKATLRKRFIQAHLLKNEDYYGINRDDKETFILNLFENENKSYEFNQTIRIRLLQALMSIGDTATLAELTDLLMNTFKYEEYALLEAYRAFVKSEIFAIRGDLNLNESDKIFHDGFTREHMYQDIKISLTFAGRYHYDLLFTLEYIEIMKFSTYTHDAIYQMIQDENQNKTVNKRNESTNNFVKYISSLEDEELSCCVVDKEMFYNYFGLISPLLSNGVKTGIEAIKL